MKILHSVLLAAGITLLAPLNSMAATKFKLGKGKLLTVSEGGKKFLCGSPSSKWIPVKKVGGGSYSQLKTAIASHKSACSSIIPRGAIKRLSQLPDVTELTKASNQGAAVRMSVVSEQAVSGTAPVIPSVPSLDVTQLFWRTGVISAINSGSPSPEQCSEFWGSNVDGQSSGQTACYMLQDVGQSIGNIIQSGNSLCYMKQVPTVSSAARIVSGSVPGGIARIFDAPSGSSPRIIRTSFSGEEGDSGTTMYIRISPSSELTAAGNLYRYDLWDCAGDRITSREAGVVKLNGDFIATSSGDSEDGAFENIVQGYVTISGRDVTFDTSRDRTVRQIFSSPGGRLSRSAITVTSANEIISKQRAVSSDENQKSYSVSSFSGASVAELRFLSGATKMSFIRPGGEDNFVGSSEFRDTFYASAPTSSYATAVNGFNFEEDSFYSGETPTPAVNTRGVSCSPRVDVTISMSMSSPAMTQIREECEGVRLDGFNMCQSDAVSQAFDNYNSVCRP